MNDSDFRQAYLFHDSRSPCSTLLVSCSTDNTAIVFDTVKDKKIRILEDHKGWVNGVAWDPSDQYIATIASDRLVQKVM